MIILAIDTSCDETSVAVTSGRRILSNVLFSQIKIHAPYGGVYPILAKCEHLAKIDPAVKLALKRARLSLNDINAIAVTFGPGLAPALEVGINKAKALANEFTKPLIPVDHIEGHIYSPFVENQNGKPKRPLLFPLMAFVISGGHTELVLLPKAVHYHILGETLDDAAGEALDKAARLLNLGYPGGPIIERLAKTGNPKKYSLPLPLAGSTNLSFSYSGLKTAFKRVVEALPEKQKQKDLNDLSASFQSVLIKSLVIKLKLALKRYPVKMLSVGGGVADNRALRAAIRQAAKETNVPVYFPTTKSLTTDNAAMIGVAAHFKQEKGIFIKDIGKLDRIPRANLDQYVPTEGIEPPAHRL